MSTSITAEEILEFGLRFNAQAEGKESLEERVAALGKSAVIAALLLEYGCYQAAAQLTRDIDATLDT